MLAATKANTKKIPAFGAHTTYTPTAWPLSQFSKYRPQAPGQSQSHSMTTAVAR